MLEKPPRKPTIKDDPGSISREKPRLDRRWLRYLALIGSLVLFAVVIWAIGPQEVVEATREADPQMVMLAAGLYGVSLLVRVIKWRLLITPLETTGQGDDAGDGNDPQTDSGVPPGLTLGRLCLIYLAGSFLDATTPGARVGGEPLKSYYLGRMLGRPKSECLATVVVEKLTNLAVLGVIAMVSLVFVLALVELRSKLWLTLAVLLALIVTGYLLAIIVWLGHRRRRQPVRKQETEDVEAGADGEHIQRARRPLLTRLLASLWGWGPIQRRLVNRFPTSQILEAHVHERIDNFTASIRQVGHRHDLIVANLILAAVMWLVVFGRTYALFVGFGSDIYYSEVAVIVTISIMLSYLAFTPGGLGVSEVVLLTLYVAFGVERSIAAAVAVLDRLIYYGFGIGLGYWALRRLEKAGGGEQSETPQMRPP